MCETTTPRADGPFARGLAEITAGRRTVLGAAGAGVLLSAENCARSTRPLITPDIVVPGRDASTVHML